MNFQIFHFIFPIFITAFIVLCLDVSIRGAIITTPQKPNGTVCLTGERIYVKALYHNKTHKYYPAYERGPCGKMMWLAEQLPDSAFGMCRCINSPLGVRPLTYWEPTHRCYFGYDKGPCEEGEWLVLNAQSGIVECQRNPCPVLFKENDMDNDLDSLVNLETNYYVHQDNVCLKNQMKLQNWCFKRESRLVSRFLFHNESQKFYPAHERGPCPSLMELQEDWSAVGYGICRCINSETGQRPIMYWKGTNRCYFGYHQGPCNKGEWLVYNEKREPECKKNPCPLSKLANTDEDILDSTKLKPETNFIVQHHKGGCYETHTKAYCPGEEKLFLQLDGFNIGCFNAAQDGSPIYGTGAGGIAAAPTQMCKSGYILDERNHCVKIATFDNETQ